MKISLDKDDISRIFFPCKVAGLEQTIIFDTGSPNTMVTLRLAKDLGLKAVSSKIYDVNIGGGVVKCAVAVLPEMTIGDITVNDVRVLAGLNAPEWRDTILLGLNVMNYFKYAVDRAVGGGTIDLNLSGRESPTGSSRGKFNHLIVSKTINGMKKSVFDVTPYALISSELSVESALLGNM